KTGEIETEDCHAEYAHSRVAASHVVELEQKRVEQHAEGQREHAEKYSHIAYAEQADRHRNYSRPQHNCKEHEFELPHAQYAGHYRGPIGAKAEKHRMPKQQ